MRVSTLRLLILMCGSFAPLLSPTLVVGEDLERGEYLFEICAPCHGSQGQGGGGGIYPRLAGLQSEYLASQLRAFKTRVRLNIPMLMFSDDRQLPEKDILDLAAYIDSLELATRTIPVIGAPRPAVFASRAVDISRAPENIEKGRASTASGVQSATGAKVGGGDGDVPALAGQHTRYLASRIAVFRRETRSHPEANSLFTSRSDAKFVDILAYLSIQEQRGPPSMFAEEG
jgi:cytochrome c553